MPGAPNLDFARKLIEHSCWEDERVWKLAIAPLTDGQFNQEVGFGLGSIRRQCAHIMETQSTGLRRIRGHGPVMDAASRGASDRAKMRERWGAIHAGWLQLASELEAALFFADRSYRDDRGEANLKVWEMIMDVVYQGSAHRSDIMRMVAEVHEAPAFDLSLMQFLTGVFRQ